MATQDQNTFPKPPSVAGGLVGAQMPGGAVGPKPAYQPAVPEAAPAGGQSQISNRGPGTIAPPPPAGLLQAAVRGRPDLPGGNAEFDSPADIATATGAESAWTHPASAQNANAHLGQAYTSAGVSEENGNLQDQTERSSATGYEATGYTGTGYDPTTREVGDGELVENRLNGLLDDNSTYLQRARARSAQASNSRGLLNSSMAASAGEAAAIDAAMPIAQQDASTMFTQGRANQDATNRASEFGANADNEANRFTAGAENQAAEFGANAENRSSEFNANQHNSLLAQNAQLEQQNNQFNASLQTGVSESNANRLTSVSVGNSDRNTQNSQFNANLNQQNEQFNAGLEQANNQFNAGQMNAFEMQRVETDASVFLRRVDNAAAERLERMSQEYRLLGQRTEMAGNMYALTMQNIGSVLSNPDMTPDQQRVAVEEIMARGDLYAGILSGLNQGDSPLPGGTAGGGNNQSPPQGGNQGGGAANPPGVPEDFDSSAWYSPTDPHAPKPANGQSYSWSGADNPLGAESSVTGITFRPVEGGRVGAFRADGSPLNTFDNPQSLLLNVIGNDVHPVEQPLRDMPAARFPHDANDPIYRSIMERYTASIEHLPGVSPATRASVMNNAERRIANYIRQGQQARAAAQEEQERENGGR